MLTRTRSNIVLIAQVQQPPLKRRRNLRATRAYFMAKSPVPVVVTPQAAVPLPTVAEFTAPMLAALTEALGANRGWSAWRRSSALCDNLSHFGSSRNSPKDNSGEAIKASGTARLSEEL